MSALTVYAENRPQQGESINGLAAMQSCLDGIGVRFERWAANGELAQDADHTAAIAAYNESIERLQQQYEFKSVDIVSLRPDHPDKAAFRQKFLAEHIHADFEVRFFIEGRGLFYLHVDGKVYAVLCEQGDLISVPANTRHWFDMGENPYFKCIRLFTTPEGWVAEFTGSDIAQSFPTFDQFVALLSERSS